eukprot:scaffold330884_cov42-Prasinocladus_malaysianus.AAC.3
MKHTIQGGGMSVFLKVDEGGGPREAAMVSGAAVARRVVLTPLAVLERRTDSYEIAERRPLQVALEAPTYAVWRALSPLSMFKARVGDHLPSVKRDCHAVSSMPSNAPFYTCLLFRFLVEIVWA